MASEHEIEAAREQWRKAVELLRAARRDFTAARVPLDPNDNGDPPAWTAQQSDAVMSYGIAWNLLARARVEWRKLQR